MRLNDRIRKAVDDCRDERFIGGINWLGFKMPLGQFEGEYITVPDTKYLEGLCFYNKYPVLTELVTEYLELIDPSPCRTTPNDPDRPRIAHLRPLMAILER